MEKKRRGIPDAKFGGTLLDVLIDAQNAVYALSHIQNLGELQRLTALARKNNWTSAQLDQYIKSVYGGVGDNGETK